MAATARRKCIARKVGRSSRYPADGPDERRATPQAGDVRLQRDTSGQQILNIRKM